MKNEYSKSVLQKRLEDAEYWSGKNGYEQEALREVIAILGILIDQVVGKPKQSKPSLEQYEGRDIGDLK